MLGLYMDDIGVVCPYMGVMSGIHKDTCCRCWLKTGEKSLVPSRSLAGKVAHFGSRVNGSAHNVAA